MRNIGSIRYEKAAGRENLFFKDASADFFVLFQEKLYSLRKEFLKESGYFAKKIAKNHRVHVIDHTLNTQVFLKIISCFYGMKCIFRRDKQINSVMQTIKFLQFKELQQILRTQIFTNISEYNIFVLIQLAQKYTDKLLLQRCYKELIRQNFEYFNFSRFQLVQCSQNTFKTLIKLHQELKDKRQIKGLSFQNIRKIVVQYNTINNTKINVLSIITPLNCLIINQDPQQQDSPLLTRKEQKKKALRKNSTQDKSAHKSQVLPTSFSTPTSVRSYKNCNTYQSCNIEVSQNQKYKNNKKIKAKEEAKNKLANQISISKLLSVQKCQAQKSTGACTQNQSCQCDLLSQPKKNLLIQSQKTPFSKKKQIDFITLSGDELPTQAQNEKLSLKTQIYLNKPNISPSSRLIKSLTNPVNFC